MNLLIVEDDQNKIKQLSKFIAINFPNISIVEKRAYQSGLEEILKNTYEFIVLDMSLPTYEISPTELEGPPKNFAGRDILHQMKRKHIYSPTIVVTQFEDFGERPNTISLEALNIELKTKFDFYLGTVFYNASSDNWQKHLLKYLAEYGDIKND